ncbi:MAG: Crp/Fnr family transcriptional regulator [Bacteroidota bacterium]
MYQYIVPTDSDNMYLKNLLPLFRNLAIKSFKKGDICIPEGATQQEVFFIRKGLVRSFYTNEKADETTFFLYPEHHVFGNAHSIFFDEPSKFSYEALEPTKAYMINYDSYFDVAAKYPQLFELNRVYFGRRVMKQAFLRVDSFVFLSPEERYKKYIQDYPNVINRAPDKYIAHILGITPVSLSRIRSRIASGKN